MSALMPTTTTISTTSPPSAPLNVIFMGTPDFAVPTLKALCEDKCINVLCVYTQPPRPSGRGYKLTPSPVQEEAEARGLPVRTPTSLKTPEALADFEALHADLTIVAAYGLILPETILTATPKGAVNVHASLLPKWRGAAPIARAIMAGDKTAGITIMQMDKGMDTGAMLAKEGLEIGSHTTATLTAELAKLGADLLLKTIKNPPAPTPQNDAEATYAPKIRKEEGELDFAAHTALELERQIRALPSFFVTKGERIKVLGATVLAPLSESDSARTPPAGTVLQNTDIVCQGGTVLRLCVLQRAGKSALPAPEFLKGFSLNASL